MDPRMQFGSGSPLLGGTDALTEAMQRRGIDASILQQVGGNAPGAMPPTGPVGQVVPGGQAQVGIAGAPESPLGMGTPESQLIIKALSERLKSDSKINEAKSIPPKPTMGGM